MNSTDPIASIHKTLIQGSGLIKSQVNKSLNWSCLTQNEPTRSNMILRAQVFRLVKIINNVRPSSNLFKLYPICVTGAIDPYSKTIRDMK